LVALGAACGSSSGTSSKPPTTGKRYKIATVGKVEGIAWFDDMKKGVARFAAETGQDAFMQSPAQADAAQQVQIIETFIAQGVDAICVVPFSVEAVEPVLKKARMRGIKVISHEASSQENADLIIEPFDNLAYGRHLMDHLAKFMGEEGEYATFVGSLNSKSHNEWVEAGVRRQLEKYPRMKNVANKIEDYEDQNKAYEKMKELLTAHPNLKGVQTSAMGTAAGTGLVVEERGLQAKISIVGTSLASVSGQYLKTGAVKLISFWDPGEAGYAMNKLAVTLLQGEQVHAGTDLGVTGYRSLVQSKDKPNLFFGNAWIDITKDNVGEFMK
jgi:simple sugar transport system substrate-binding protein